MERYPNLPPVTKQGKDAFSYLIQRWSGQSTNAHQVLAYEDARSIEGALTLALLNGLPVKNARVLDVGAGSGSDSCFLKNQGSKEVIALEPNFLLLARGQDLFPDLTWLGGSAVALPIGSESMDLVIANASLHHHLDAEISLDEMLRVLKPGGWLVTVGDSIKGSSREEVTVDYQQWDVHPSVLRGINEQILRMDVLLKRITIYGDAVRGEVFLREGNTGEWKVWSLEKALKMIVEQPRMWGVMGMRVQKLRSLKTPDYRIPKPSVSTTALARAVLEQTDFGAGYSLLSQMLAPNDLRSQAPVTEINRLLQLNG
jgi:ubiquinone/menaquinone biosynthesis C-methylase UbiE